MTLHLDILTSSSQGAEGLTLGSPLYREVLDGDAHVHQKRLMGLLNAGERALLTPEYIEATELHGALFRQPGMDPREFRRVVALVAEDMKSYPGKYPIEFTLNGRTRTESFLIKNSHCYIEGYSDNVDHPSHVKLVCSDHGDDPSETFIPIGEDQRSLGLGDRTFSIDRCSAYERYRSDFEAIFKLCDTAASRGNNVLWYVIV
jgi:hypothetical protein